MGFVGNDVSEYRRGVVLELTLAGTHPVEIGKYLGISRVSVYRYQEQLGVRAPKKSYEERERLRGPQREATASGLRAEYEAGFTLMEVAAKFELSYGTTRTLILEAGGRMRSRHG